MSTNRHIIPAAPDEVFAVLADARTYEHWVVGCDDIRAVEGDWPAVGSRFFHTVGVGPLKTKDNTKVLEVDPPRRLVLEARARPAGVAKVIFVLRPLDGGTATEVEIDEYPIRGVAKVIDNPVQDGLIKVRNVETLRRLEKQVLQRRETPTP
ncbi:MAG TPA: SRPBCC family protein [Acidimicrobiales bacterium]|nr:SRPBCC family protein [Acidimicrobiales bacterium]